ncbi:MAG: hypothetical protein M0R22_00905 [Dehalococcoidia bacterium]|jgi:hypothetical protein|nr:hypothetical protein [Dehalococcoidia bacterium]
MKPEPQSKAQEEMLRRLMPQLQLVNAASVIGPFYIACCRGLCGVGLVREVGDGQWAITDAGQQWVREHPEVRT